MGNYLNKSLSNSKINEKNEQNPESVLSKDENSADFLDVIFCIDTTGSMGSYIERSKTVINNMIKLFSKNKEKPLFGVVAYRDHPPEDISYITMIHPLGDASSALDFVKKLNAEGGGDAAEAVLQGLFDSVNKIEWRNIEKTDKTYRKLLIHVGDAPPHGKEFGSSGDHWPEGCPSGITVKKLADIMNENKIFYHFCRLTHETDLMADLFKKNFNNFQLIDLIVNAQNIQHHKAEFENYKKMNSAVKNLNLDDMPFKRQQEMLYEAEVSNCVQKNFKSFK